MAFGGAGSSYKWRISSRDSSENGHELRSQYQPMPKRFDLRIRPRLPGLLQHMLKHTSFLCANPSRKEVRLCEHFPAMTRCLSMRSPNPSANTPTANATSRRQYSCFATESKSASSHPRPIIAWVGRRSGKRLALTAKDPPVIYNRLSERCFRIPPGLSRPFIPRQFDLVLVL